MSYCIETLKEAFAARQRLNAAYSLRAFARDLEINPGSLSSILKGQRRVPSNAAEDLAVKLKLPPQKRQKFIKSIARRNPNPFGIEDLGDTTPNIFDTDELHYRIIAEWEHYAVLNLMQLEAFVSEPAWIAERLALPLNRIEVVLKRLLEAGLAERDPATGTLRRTMSSLRTTEDVRSTALRQAHLEELELARDKLDQLEAHPELRDYSSVTIAADPRKLPEAKEVIRRFRREMAALLADGPQTEVYQLCLQLFPLTRAPQRRDS